MAILDELVTQIENPDLRARIAAEVEKLAKQKKFGLVFEEHLPECTPLWDIPVKKGGKVALKTGQVSDFYTVLKIEDGIATCLNKDKSATAEFKVDELVSVAEFGEPIYPYLKPIDTVCNGPDSDLWHTLIEADNYHALQLLEYLYAGKVDCIYIDPPYNTGARDWKYNNDYVDNSDQYRHSKWLSMMEKRLKLAKRLLNPQDSVLIVTIDEKEYLHLGCLLEEMFPEANMQMISSVINPYGTQRLNEFSRNDEYIFFVMFGSARPTGVVNENAPEQSYWKTFRRGDLASRRGQPKGGKAQFYPIYVENATRKIVSIGDPIAPDVDRHSVAEISGCTAVFPLRDDGTEMNWCVRPEAARVLLEKGYIKAGSINPKTQQLYPILYLRSGTIDDINSGKLLIDGYSEDGSIIAHYEEQKEQMPQTNWHIKEHSARDYGSNLIRMIFRDKRFTFPKSLYAVKDCIYLFTKGKPNALIVDFFAGSGTTLHAVNLLNAEDGGHRRCIMVTNNEVSADEAKALSAHGYQPGDPEWEKLGIAHYVTWPRTVCSIEGHDVNGKLLKGDYITSGEEPMHMADGFKANAAFFKLGFLDKNAVALGRQFKEMLPTLWMKAGAHGACPTIGDDQLDMLILPENKFAVLVDEKAYMAFAEKLDEHPEIETVFIITDSESGYRDMIAGLNVKESYQLYRDYLDNFRINAARR
ncbi:MAG: site-specific DNA-methyltransferase [Faecousia sp.]